MSCTFPERASGFRFPREARTRALLTGLRSHILCERHMLLCRYAHGAYAGLAGARVGAGGPGGRQDLLLSGDANNSGSRLGEQEKELV